MILMSLTLKPRKYYYYTPRNEVRGVYWNHPVRPSVSLSVRLSVDARLGKMVSSA